MQNFTLFLIISLFINMLSACKRTGADVIILNATVYTVDSLFSKTQSMAVIGGKIAATGSSEEISGRYESNQTIDCTGKFVYPGFIDAHAHFYGYGTNLTRRADLSGTKSPEEIYEILQQHYKKSGGTWLLGRGWDQNDWPDKCFPDNTLLDKLFPDVAVYLIRVDGHAGWCNSKALTLAGITANTKIDGGEVVLKNGRPTGVLIDNAENLVAAVVPEPDESMRIKALLAAQENCLHAGLTSVTDCGLSKNVILLIDSLQKQGSLKIRLNAMINPDEETLSFFMHPGGYKTGRLLVNTVKLYADGALGSRGALLLEPYADDPGNRGLQLSSQQFLDDICRKALENNFQVAIHAIGDSANRLVLHTYGKFLREKNNKRWRIEHAQIIHPDDFDLFSEYSVVPSVQALHATSDMYWAAKRLGNSRIQRAYPYRQLMKQLGWIPNGTDFPIEKIFPLHTFYASVFRKDDKGIPTAGFQIENSLTREEALRSITIWAAKASFEENEKGSLEPGKMADFVILDKDLMTSPPEDVLKTIIESVYIAGEKVY